MAADGNMKPHPNFLDKIENVVETPGYVYFTSHKIPENDLTDPGMTLFRYDKQSEELIPLSTYNFLTDNSVRAIVYNAYKKYLFVLNQNNDINLLYDDGRIINIPFYRLENSITSKGVNGITLDPLNDRVYMATDFGFVSINDKKGEIAESRDYGRKINSLCRVGEVYLLITNEGLLTLPVSSGLHNSFSDNEPVEIEIIPKKLFYLGNDFCVITGEKDGKLMAARLSLESGKVKISPLSENVTGNIDYNKSGLTIKSRNEILLLTSSGDTSKVTLSDEYKGGGASTIDMNQIWYVEKYKGLKSLKSTGGGEWAVTREFVAPDSPSIFAATDFAMHPEKGLLMVNYGFNPATSSLYQMTPVQINGYNSGRWQNYSPSLTNPGRGEIMRMANGLAIDPDNNRYIYVSSPHNGFMRFNLENPKDILHFSRRNDKGASSEGFYPLVETSSYLPNFANFSAPRFDRDGNLWMNYADWDDRNDPNPHFYCWTSTQRRNFLSGNESALPELVEIEAETPVSNSSLLLPLTKTGNGLLVFTDCQYKEILLLIDTNGTPTDTSDDRIFRFAAFIDNDGNTVDVSQAKFIWEDPATGYVWIGHRNGIFYFIPAETVSGDYTLYRVKVSRDDGTGLADYLLDGVTVNAMTSDSEGRKWFATNGGGIVCTTTDGSAVIKEVNTSNSSLPDDVTYGIAYDSKANSIMVSTSKGLAEYFLPANTEATGKRDIKAYPNPVRPEYNGFVTLTEIPDGSLVKIIDSRGNTIKELGIVSGFSILWDLSDTSSRRVPSGVYYIMTSPSSNSNSFYKVGKILVVS
ncbi:MAG: hypothetical protein J1E78_03220 [Muribaculaceae bacterium]|nr:hypothetical protein [Muribaculaceae bacterium]